MGEAKEPSDVSVGFSLQGIEDMTESQVLRASDSNHHTKLVQAFYHEAVSF